MELQSTLEFLRSLTTKSSYDAEDHILLDSLKRSLGVDGYNLSRVHYLRGLEALESPNDPEFIVNLVCIFLCVLCAGFASGLTQGLLSLDFMEMTIKSRSGTEEEKVNAAKVIPIISNHHLLLVTLMLWNASATEALPIFLNKLVPEYLAIIISVTMVLFVGEIIPASILTGPNQLTIAARLVPMVYLVLFIFYPIAYPISRALDYLLGHDTGMTMYNRQEISTMISLQHEEGVIRQSVVGHHGKGAHLDAVHQEEVAIIGGALKFREIMVSTVMTPVHNTFMIPATEKLSYKTLYEIFKSGYSRIPVYDTDVNDIIGLILAKDLIFVDAEDETPVRNFIELFGRKPAVVWHDDKLGDTLSMFRHTRGHMAIVRDVVSEGNGDPVYKVVGIITLEDIIEEILGTEIADETDYSVEGGDGDSAPHLFRDMDFIRLKLLHTKMSDDVLSSDEVRGIVAHLSANVPQVQHLFSDNAAGLTELIQRSSVLNMKRKSAEGALKPSQDDMLYRRGKMSNTCVLILSGKLTVLAGKDEFQSEKGPWSTLGADALTAVEGTYVPDFSAYVSSESIRFVSISMTSTLAGHQSGHSLLDINTAYTPSGSFGVPNSRSSDPGSNSGHSYFRRNSATRSPKPTGGNSNNFRSTSRDRKYTHSSEGKSTNPLLLQALLSAKSADNNNEASEQDSPHKGHSSSSAAYDAVPFHDSIGADVLNPLVTPVVLSVSRSASSVSASAASATRLPHESYAALQHQSGPQVESAAAVHRDSIGEGGGGNKRNGNKKIRFEEHLVQQGQQQQQSGGEGEQVNSSGTSPFTIHQQDEE